MRKIIINMDEMSDSKEVYGQRPNPFISGFIYCILALLIAAIVYSCIGTIEITATATGVVRPNDEVSTASSLLSGKVTESNYTDGMEVKKGDVLLKVDTSELEISLDKLNETKKDYETSQKYLKMFLKGIKNNNTNPFSSSGSDEELNYYSQFEKYVKSLKSSQNSATYDMNNNAANISAVNTKISELEAQLAGLNAYKKSVENNCDMATNYPEYEKMYELYASNVKSMDDEYAASKKTAEAGDTTTNACITQYSNYVKEYGYLIESIEKDKNMFPIGDASSCVTLYHTYCSDIEKLSEEEKEDYKSQLIAQYQQTKEGYETLLNTYKEKFNTDVNSNLDQLKTSYENQKEQLYLNTITQIDSSIQSIESEISSAKSTLNTYQVAADFYGSNTDSDGTPLTVSMTTLDEIASVTSQQASVKEQINDVKAQIKQTKKEIEQGTIKAERDGTLNVVNEISKGDVISSGTVIATILPAKDDLYRVQIYVNNKDMANIKEGNEIRYNLSAFPSSQYGVVNGKVTTIASDSLIKDGEYSGYYLIEGTIDKTKLTDKDGNSGTITSGMEVQAKIVTQKKTIIRYLLEKINLF